MTLIVSNSETNNVSNFNKIELGRKLHIVKLAKISEKEAFKAEFKEALNQALDIIEENGPRKSLRDIFNG